MTAFTSRGSGEIEQGSFTTNSVGSVLSRTTVKIQSISSMKYILLFALAVCLPISVPAQDDKGFEHIAAKNARVLGLMGKDGDVQSQSRPVDHWIYFNSRADSRRFITECRKQGYKTGPLVEIETDSPWLYILNIMREDNLLPINVNEFTWYLYRLAKENNGLYEGWASDLVTETTD